MHGKSTIYSQKNRATGMSSSKHIKPVKSFADTSKVIKRYKGAKACCGIVKPIPLASNLHPGLPTNPNKF